MTRVVLTARRVLQECDGLVARAIATFNAGDIVGADLEMTRALALLPELFCCRNISSGFGAAILGMFYAAVNAKGEALTINQLIAMQRCTEFLSENLFITFEGALDLLDGLEDVGLTIDPPEATALGELFAGQ